MVNCASARTTVKRPGRCSTKGWICSAFTGGESSRSPPGKQLAHRRPVDQAGPCDSTKAWRVAPGDPEYVDHAAHGPGQGEAGVDGVGDVVEHDRTAFHVEHALAGFFHQ